MMNSFATILADNLKKAKRGRATPVFRSGDTLRVQVKVVEGDKSRLQAFEGICIARKNAGLGSSFTVRKLSYGEGVERTFPLYSPLVDSIEVVRMGRVRRAKLYYLKGRKGKSARIAEEFRSALAMKGDEIATAADIDDDKIDEIVAAPETKQAGDDATASMPEAKQAGDDAAASMPEAKQAGDDATASMPEAKPTGDDASSAATAPATPDTSATAPVTPDAATAPATPDTATAPVTPDAATAPDAAATPTDDAAGDMPDKK